MKAATLIGIILIVIGAIALSYQGYVWVTGSEEVARVGPIEIERERSFPIPIVPIVGGLALVAGIILAARGASSRTAV